MKRILLVDYDQGTQLSLPETLTGRDEGFEVHTVRSGRTVAAEMEVRSFDLLVIGLPAPESDGFRLLAFLRSKHPFVPVVLLIEAEQDSDPSETWPQCLPKPVDSAFLLATIRRGLEEGSGAGTISLPFYAKLLQSHCQTCTLKISSGRRAGLLYFSDGVLINAFSGPFEPNEAAREILGWQEAIIEFQNTCNNRERLVTSPMMDLLPATMPGGARRPEPAAQEADLPPKPTAGEINSPDGAPTFGDIDDLGFVFPNLAHHTFMATPRTSSASELAEKDPGAASGASAETLSIEDFSGIIKSAGDTPRKNPWEKLLELVRSLEGIRQVAFISRQGRLLYRESMANEAAAFFGHVLIAAEQIGGVLGSAGFRVVVLERSSGESLILLAGPRLLVGLGLAAGTDPGGIADVLHPVVDHITLGEERRKHE
jgi:CheY-like chemotaxis protein